MGETGDKLYTRTQNHLSSIRATSHAMSLPVRSHFIAEGHSIEDVRIVGLERVWGRSVFHRRARENRWMNLLGTRQEAGGMNKRHG